MGFEFGYAVADPSTLVLWEGQFGDFANGAQVIIDQFISGSEQKWNQRCGLVLLLPHGQEGQGPEHSSARLERFLTLCAEDNMRVANVSTPAQYYHLLLRQMAGDVRKPLVVMTPKSLLRHPKVVSTIDELADGAFHPVLDDPAGPSRARRVILASGKVAWDLIAAREKADRTDVAIVRLEQFYPFPGKELGAGPPAVSRRTPSSSGCRRSRATWAAGASCASSSWTARSRASRPAAALRYIGRRELASPAPGSHHAFAHEQEQLVAEALRVGAREKAAV